ISGESRTSSTRPASSSDPVSTTEASSRWSLEVAVADRRPAAPTIALSWFRSRWPKSASSSGSSESWTAGAPSAGLSLISPLREALCGRLWCRGEHRLLELDALGAEVLLEHRTRACRRVVSDRTAICRNSQLPEREQLLQHDLAVLHPHHLGDGDDLSRTTAQSLGLDHDVHRLSDLSPDCARWKLCTREQHQRFEPVDR